MFSSKRKETRRHKAIRRAIESLESRVLLAYSLDPTFDGDGLVIGPPGFGARDVNVQSDGKVLAASSRLGETGAGDFLIRYNPNGSLDSSFGGGDGRVDLPDWTFFGDVQVRGNKILAGVSKGEEDVQYVYRYNLDGSLDTSFGGGDGIADVHGIMNIAGLAVQSDGKIDVTGSETHIEISPHDPTYRNRVFDTQTVTRLNADGSLDTSFGGGDGYVSAQVDAGDHFIAGIGIQPGTSNILVVGSDSSEQHVIVTAWSPDGTFAFRAIAPQVQGNVSDLAFQSNGSIILGSDARGVPGDSRGSLVRLLPTGQYDSTFAGGNPSSFGQTFSDLEVLPDGRILAAGNAWDPGSTYSFAIVRRFTANGLIDQTFAPPRGYVRADWGQQSEGISIDVQNDGKIVLGGSGSSPPDQHPIGLARFVDTSQKPFKGSPFNVGDTIQAEDFDIGGEGVAYHDNDASNNGGAYRAAEGVDIQPTTDTGGGYNVGWTNPNEWMEYTINVPTAGAYTIDNRLASPRTGSTFHYEIDGRNVSGSITIPNTGTYQTWRTITGNLGSLTAGTHVLRLAINSGANDGAVNFNWMKINAASTGGGSGTGLKGEYFDNMEFTALALTRTDSKVDFNWGTGSPDPRMQADTFSVRWSGKILAPTSGRYSFYTTTDDGVRLTVNGQRIIDHFAPQAATEWSGSIDLVAGQKYDISMEYFERYGGALAKLQWSGPGIAKQVVPTSQLFPTRTPDSQPPSQVADFQASRVTDTEVDVVWSGASDNVGVAGFELILDNGLPFQLDPDARGWTYKNLQPGSTHSISIRAFDEAGNRGPLSTIQVTTTGAGGSGNGLKGEYFNNMDFTASAFTRTDANVNFNWGTGSPDSRIAPDTFSVRWSGRVIAHDAGRYTFYTTTDDGVRLTVNGERIIDHLTPQAPTEWSGSVNLFSGGADYNIVMEYFERFGGASAKLEWSGPGFSRQVIPQNSLTPQQPANTAVPAAPALLSATGEMSPDNQPRIRLKYQPGDRTSFIFIERAPAGTTNFAEIAHFLAIGPNYTYFDENLPRNTSFTYRLRAWNDAGFGPYSNSLTATTPA